MKHLLRWLVAALLVLAAPLASATFHTFQIEEIYSNADGSVQYVVLHEAADFGGQNFLGGHTLTSTITSPTAGSNCPPSGGSDTDCTTTVLVQQLAIAVSAVGIPDFQAGL